MEFDTNSSPITLIELDRLWNEFGVKGVKKRFSKSAGDILSKILWMK